MKKSKKVAKNLASRVKGYNDALAILSKEWQEMNREQAKNLLPVIQAYADGKTIQIYTEDGWEDLTGAGFICLPDRYRIKPEPLEGWGTINNEDPNTMIGWESRDTATCAATRRLGHRVIHWREVEK